MSHVSIFSWNVNGFRSILKKNFMGWLELRNPDILCLQEIRSEWHEIDLSVRRLIENEYQVTWHSCLIKKGYSGTALFVRKGLEVITQSTLGIPEIDQEGRLIEGLLGKTLLLSGYFPNASDSLKRLDYKRAFSSQVVRRVQHHQALGHDIIVVGDLNVAPEPLDLYNPEANTSSPGFTDEEREDFRQYLSTGLVDIHRHLNPRSQDIYTWWSNRIGARARNAGWRIDIFLISESLLGRVKKSSIHANDMGSDHCPIELQIEI